MTENQVFKVIFDYLDKLPKVAPIRVAINGIEGAGKTVFAEKFTKFLREKKKDVHHISIDGFHFNKEHRYKQGRNSAIGYYEDAYDELAFVKKVLISSQDENPTITTATHNLESDEYISLSPINISKNSIIVTDGAYLFKPNYREHWDLKIYLKTDFKTAILRGMNRDKNRLGGLKAAKEKYDNRYHKASKIYIQENSPEEIADIVIDNTDFSELEIVKRW